MEVIEGEIEIKGKEREKIRNTKMNLRKEEREKMGRE